MKESDKLNNLNRLSSLDGLRGIAALGVSVFWHYQHFAPQNGYPFSHKAYWFYNYGFSLVDFFFVISGFVFCYVYKEKITKRLIDFKEYSILRFSRLYPLHLLTLILVAMVQYVRYCMGEDFFVYQLNDTYHFILNLLFIQNGWFEHGFSFNAPTWSLAVELIAYILFFFVLHAFNNRNRYVSIFIFLVLLGIFLKRFQFSIPLLNQETSRVLIGFFMGCLTYEINDYMVMLKKQKLLIVILGGIIFLIVTFISVSFGHEALGDWQLVYAIIIFPLGIILVLNTKPLNFLLSLSLFEYLGKISYSIYLLHFPIQLIIKTINDFLVLNIDFSTKSFFTTFVLTTIAASILSYEFIEKPSQKYLRKRVMKQDDNDSIEVNSPSQTI